MNDEILKLIIYYRDRPIRKNTPDDELLKRAYENWACEELIDRITDNPFDDPEQIIEAFYYETISYSIQVNAKDCVNGFEAAKNLLEELLEVLLLMFDHPTE